MCLSWFTSSHTINVFCLPYFMIHLLRGLLGSGTADADIEFEFIQGRHNIRQYRGRQRGYWNANRLLGPRRQGKEIGQDDNASKPLQFVKKATLLQCCYSSRKNNIQKSEESRNKIVARCTTLMLRLRNACKVGVFQFIAVCFFQGTPLCVLVYGGPWMWMMFESERDTGWVHVGAGAGVHAHFLHASFSSWVAFQCMVCFVSQVGMLHQEEAHRTGRPHRTLSHNKLRTSAAEQ